MKYFFDTEFLEGKQPKKLLGFTYGYTKPTIDLISIGIVAEDDRAYFALSNEFNLDWAWEKSDGLNKQGIPIYWIRDNVLLPIYKKYVSGDARNKYDFSKGTMRYLMDNYGRSNEEIAKDIVSFVSWCGNDTNEDGNCSYCHNKGGCMDKPQFYAYFADYDWVVSCWLFGRMLDLPKNFPYYCRDLKQMLDEKVERFSGLILNGEGKKANGEEIERGYARDATFSEKLEWIKGTYAYPKQTNEHCALADAKWNKELYKFIQDFK